MLKSSSPALLSAQFLTTSSDFSNVLYVQQESSANIFECSSVPKTSNTWSNKSDQDQSLFLRHLVFVMATQAVILLLFGCSVCVDVGPHGLTRQAFLSFTVSPEFV